MGVRKLGVSPNFFKFACMGRIKPRAPKDSQKELKRDSKKLKNSPKKQKNDTLKNAIEALGGDAEEDYELVKDVDSDGWEDGKTAQSDVYSLIYSVIFF